MEKRTQILGWVIDYDIPENPDYELKDDTVSLEHVEQALYEGYVEGELFDYTSDKEFRGWWAKVR